MRDHATRTVNDTGDADANLRDLLRGRSVPVQKVGDHRPDAADDTIRSADGVATHA